MANAIQFLIKPQSQKRLEVNSRMESAMEQIINQMNQLNLHLLQPKISKSKNMEGAYQQLNVTNVKRWDIIQKISKLVSLVY
jgi:hypothetical protein